jgi:hypothetical protein
MIVLYQPSLQNAFEGGNRSGKLIDKSDDDIPHGVTVLLFSIEKTKLAARVLHPEQIVGAITNFPSPASPESQQIGQLSGSDAHRNSFARMSWRLPG